MRLLRGLLSLLRIPHPSLLGFLTLFYGYPLSPTKIFHKRAIHSDIITKQVLGKLNILY